MNVKKMKNDGKKHFNGGRETGGKCGGKNIKDKRQMKKREERFSSIRSLIASGRFEAGLSPQWSCRNSYSLFPSCHLLSREKITQIESVERFAGSFSDARELHVHS